MASEEKKSPSGSGIQDWKLPRFEPDDEYSQEMSHEDLQDLALKLKGYGGAADPLERERPS